MSNPGVGIILALAVGWTLWFGYLLSTHGPAVEEAIAFPVCVLEWGLFGKVVSR